METKKFVNMGVQKVNTMAGFSSMFLKMFNGTRRYYKIFEIYPFKGTSEERRFLKTKVTKTSSVIIL